MNSLSKRTFGWLGLAIACQVAGLTPHTLAQEQLWISQFGSSERDYANALAPDDAGGMMIAGYTDGNLAGANSGDFDAWLARYDGAGNRIWIRQFGTSAFDSATALASDDAGGAFVAGNTDGSLGGSNAGRRDPWIARYDAAGSRLWIRQFGTDLADSATSLAPDGTGGVIVAGFTSGDLGGPQVGSGDVFLARYDGSGNQIWARQFGTTSGDLGLALTADGAGGAMVAGYTNGDLGGQNTGQQDAFLARYDGAGNQLWLRQFGTNVYDLAVALAPDGEGGVMVAGETGGSLGGPSAGRRDVFIARYDAAGNRLWIRQFGTDTTDTPFALAQDGAGGVTVAGWTEGDLGGPNAGLHDPFLVRYDGAGNQVWIRQFGTSEYDDAWALAYDGAGGVVVAGYTRGVLGHANAGSDDVFLTLFGACDPCDMNCDGDVNALDIENFLGLLFAGDVPCDTCTGDVNGDGSIDALDIEPFLLCLFQ